MPVRVEKQINPLDFNSNVAIGIKLPITIDSSNYINLNYTTFDQVKTNLRNLLMTEPGERFMVPDFGCGLRRKLFEQNTPKLIEDIRTTILNTVSTWMPFLQLNRIDVTTDGEHQIGVRLQYQMKTNEDENDELILQPIRSTIT